jgi:hypothetical protein
MNDHEVYRQISNHEITIDQRISILENAEYQRSVLDRRVREFEEKEIIYKEQIAALTSDFVHERKELTETKSKLDRMEREQLYNFAERRRQSLGNYEQQYYQKVYDYAAKRRVGGIGKPQTADVALDTLDERDEGFEDSEPTLECPKCSKSYPTNLHDDVLEHYNICTKQ